jgi:photosystem II stability/assembly factor-like uncharacterized protein
MLRISNRKYSELSYRAEQRARLELPDFRLKSLTTSHSALATAFLIHGSAIKARANLHCFNHMRISNRRQTRGKPITRRSDQDRRPERTQRVEGRLLQAFLIHGSAIKTLANLHCFNHMQISNRRQTGGKPTRLFALELSELLVECAPVRTLLLTILFVSPAAAQSWTVETTGWDSNLRAVTATYSSNPQRHTAPVIWASGSNGRTLRSNDGGEHYTRGLVNAGQPHSLDLRGIQAFNEKLAYVMASGPGNMSRIYKTHNGGETWKLQFSGTGQQFFLDALACISETECFALSDPVDGKFVLISTTDGEHWKELPRDSMPAALPDEGAFAASNSCLAIYDKREIYFVTGGGAARVFHSPDLGRTWTVTDTPIAKGSPSLGAFSIARLGSMLVVVGGDYKDDAGAKRTAAYSLDGGVTWNLAARAPTGFRSAVAFLNRDTLLTAGTAGEDISTDHGAHWTRTDDINLNAIAVLDGAAWAVGPNATIVHWTDRTH